MKRMMILGTLIFVLLACDNNDDDDMPDETVDYTFEFTDDAEGWEGDFADYQAGQADRYELIFEYSTLPAPLDEDEGALALSGTNLSDDLFMFIKRKVTGLNPNTTYNATFRVEFASDVPDGMAGVGGSPGESVFIKAGATQTEPVPVIDDQSQYYRMNIDKGNQSQGGADVAVIGDFSNDTDQELYTLKTVSNESSFIVASDENGELWLIVGTDSGFEGTTTIFYNTITVEFEEQQ